ncbi:helix-turn-helix domain-containing protein [Calidifontibacter terrae]
MPVTLERALEVDGFSSSLAARQVGDLGVTRLRSEAQSVNRTPELVGLAPGDLYFLNLPTRGHGLAIQDGRRVATGPGDFVLIDGARPFSLSFAASFDQITLTIPHAMLDPLLAQPADCTGRLISSASPVGAIASAAVRALAGNPARSDNRAIRGVTGHVLGLVALAVSDAVPQPQQDSRCQTLQAALDEIDRSLFDPALHPADVAARLCISVSYLTKLFAAQGTSFCRVLLHRRLDRAYELLAVGGNEPVARGTVTQVAYACGFADPAHFARVFRGRFGITPTQRLAADRARPGRAPTTRPSPLRSAPDLLQVLQ